MSILYCFTYLAKSLSPFFIGKHGGWQENRLDLKNLLYSFVYTAKSRVRQRVVFIKEAGI